MLRGTISFFENYFLTSRTIETNKLDPDTQSSEVIRIVKESNLAFLYPVAQ